MNPDFPLLIGRVAPVKNWSLHLPAAFNWRIEEDQMVIWRPGFTIWLTAWKNDKHESVAQRKDQIALDASPQGYDEWTTQDGEFSYYSYRLAETSEDERADAFYGFAIGDDGHLLLSIYFDEERDVTLARDILNSVNGSPADLDDPWVLSHDCFATNRVMVDNQPVGYMYRESPDRDKDSGWRFLAGDETQDYLDDPSNTEVYRVAIVAETDPAVIPYLEAAADTQFERDGDGFRAVS